MTTSERDELSRVREEYERRDALAPASGYSWGNPAYVRYMQGLERALLAALAGSAALTGGRVLDVGCGSGYLLQRLVEYGAGSATGVDLMPARIEEGQRRHPTLDLRAGSATELPFEAADFDVVTQFTCLSSVLEPAVRAAIGAEMWRVVRPGGLVVSFDMTPSAGQRAAAAARRRRGAGAQATPVVPLARDELERLFPGPVLAATRITSTVGLGALGRSRLAGHVLSLPPLRTHLLLAVRRPDE